MSHRYWRVRVTAAQSGNQAVIAELELRASIGGADITGSGTASTGGSGVDPEDAFDNDPSTFWHSGYDIGGSLPNYLRYDLGSGNDALVMEIAITAQDFGSADTAPSDFTIDYSDNGSSWTTARTVTGETGWTLGETRTFETTLTPPVTETGTVSLIVEHAAQVTGDASVTLDHVLSEFGQPSLTVEHAVQQFGDVSLNVAHVLSEFGAPSLTLNHVSIPITGVVGLNVYHRVIESGTVSLTVEHNVTPVTGAPSLTVNHKVAYTGAPSLTVIHRPQAESVGKEWQLKVWLDDEDVSDQITGRVSIEANKGAARIADFLFRPMAGVLDPQSYVKKPVAIDYLTYSGDTLKTYHRRFTGIIDEATFDPVTRLVSFVCTDNLQASLEAQDFSLIDQWVGGYYSSAIFDETDNGWEYAQQRLSSQAASFDKDVFGQTRKWSWVANNTPDAVIAAGDVIDGSIGLTQNTSRDVVNQVEISFSFAYGRLWQRELRAYWRYPRSFADYLVLSSDLPNREMFISAIDKSWWVKSLAFTKLPPSGSYDTDSGLTNWVISDTLRDSLIIGANAVLAKRWVQDVVEDYTITVSSPASIARFGEAKQVNRYAWQVPVNDGFEQVQQSTPALNEYGSLTTSSYQSPPAGSQQLGSDYFLDDDQRAAFNEAIKTTIAIARTDILRSHHQNEVSVSTLLNPYVDLGDTIEIDTSPINAVGTLGQIVELYDIDAGVAHSTLSINVFAPNVADQSDDAIAAPQRPETVPDEALINFELNTYLGGSDVTTPHDPDWRGFLGNYAGLKTFNAVTYPHEFRLETPDVSAAFREQQVIEADSSAVVAIPQETLTITVVDGATPPGYLIATTILTPTTEMSTFG